MNSVITFHGMILLHSPKKLKRASYVINQLSPHHAGKKCKIAVAVDSKVIWYPRHTISVAKRMEILISLKNKD